jgi:hypothetical protein
MWPGPLVLHLADVVGARHRLVEDAIGFFFDLHQTQIGNARQQQQDRDDHGETGNDAVAYSQVHLLPLRPGGADFTFNYSIPARWRIACQYRSCIDWPRKGRWCRGAGRWGKV